MALISEFFQRAPKVPAFVPVSPQEEQRKATAGNLAALPELEKLGGQVNQFNVDQISKMLERFIPGYSRLRDKTTALTEDFLAGRVPGDVGDEISRTSAVKALYGGYGGGGMHRNLTARDIGRTSLDLIGKGMDSAARWISAARSGLPQFDVTSMFIKPETQLAHATSERNAAFQRQYVENIGKQQYSFAGNWARFEDTVAQLAGSIIGGSGSTYTRPETAGAPGPTGGGPYPSGTNEADWNAFGGI